MGTKITIDMSKRGANGGKARHLALTPERRVEIARAGALQMWANKRARLLAAAAKLAKRKPAAGPVAKRTNGIIRKK